MRWVDYWDSSSFDDALYASLRRPQDSFPSDLKDGQITTQAAPELVTVATAVHGAFRAADATAAGDLMHTDVLLEDMSLRTQVIGRIEATAYLGRILDAVPYGRSSRLRHVVGGSNGGGFEWTASPAADSLAGVTALELDAEGLVARITSVYDSRQLEGDRKAGLTGAAFAP